MRLAAAAREDLWAACEDEALTKLWTFQSLGGPSQAPLNIDHPQYKPYLNFQSRSEAAVPKRPFRSGRSEAAVPDRPAAPARPAALPRRP